MFRPDPDYAEQIASGFIDTVRRHPRMTMEVDGEPQWMFRDRTVIDLLVRQGRLEVRYDQIMDKTTFRLPPGTPRYKPT